MSRNLGHHEERAGVHWHAVWLRRLCQHGFRERYRVVSFLLACLIRKHPDSWCDRSEKLEDGSYRKEQLAQTLLNGNGIAMVCQSYMFVS